MCRMLVALGDFSGEALLQGLCRTAQDRNELHELNKHRHGEFRHGDGWGSVYRESNELRRYRSLRPCWEDPRLPEFIGKKLVMLHARRASPESPVILANVHPFQAEFAGRRWFLCHNGTLHEQLPEFAGLEGTTDSERLLHLLLQNYDEQHDLEGIAAVVGGLRDYTSLNLFLLNDLRLYVLNLYRKHPRYHTLWLGHAEDGLVIASERLNLGETPVDWEPLENGTLLRLDHDGVIEQAIRIQ